MAELYGFLKGIDFSVDVTKGDIILALPTPRDHYKQYENFTETSHLSWKHKKMLKTVLNYSAYSGNKAIFDSKETEAQ